MIFHDSGRFHHFRWESTPPKGMEFLRFLKVWTDLLRTAARGERFLICMEIYGISSFPLKFVKFNGNSLEIVIVVKFVNLMETGPQNY